MDNTVYHIHSLSLGAALAVGAMIVILLVIAVSVAYPMVMSFLPNPPQELKAPIGFHP